MITRPFDEGILAAGGDASSASNPYPEGTLQHADWHSGFDRAKTAPDNPPRRWGYRQPGHQLITQLYESRRESFRSLLARVEEKSPFLHSIDYEAETSAPGAPYWNNGFFTGLDAAVLVTILATRSPRRFVEIGSGNSTAFARHTIKTHGLQTRITSIDPEPRREIDEICDKVVRVRLERCDQAIFEELEAGDFLFFDGSHMVEPDNDVTVFFLEIMPKLKPGVLVQIHDIFWPDDYTQRWGLNNEQYMLGLMMLANPAPFEIIAANFFICSDIELRSIVKEIFKSRDGGHDIPFCTYGIPDLTGTSVWLEMK